MLKLRNKEAKQRDLFQEWLPRELFSLGEELSVIDRILEDERFFEPFRRRFNTKVGRPSVPIEVYVRLMYLKTRYGIGYETLVKEVSDSISWRTLSRLSLSDRVPDSTTLIKLTKKYGDIVEELNGQLIKKAKEEKVIRSRKVRVDTTVVESDIHHPTDANLIAEGVNKLVRVMKKAQSCGIAGEEKIVDRTMGIKRKLAKIGNIVRQKGRNNIQEIDRVTKELMSIGRSVLRKARVVLDEARSLPSGKRVAEELNRWVCLTERVISQAKEVISGNRHIKNRVVSIHGPGARPIKKGSTKHPVQFGRKVSFSECEEGFITAYHVYRGNPPDREVLIKTVAEHIEVVDTPPKELSAARGMGSSKNEATLHGMGIERVCLPRRAKKTKEHREYERLAWFRRLKRWRPGIEARIGLLKRKYGLSRSLFRGDEGTNTWVGLGVFAHNVDRFARFAMQT